MLAVTSIGKSETQNDQFFSHILNFTFASEGHFSNGNQIVPYNSI